MKRYGRVEIKVTLKKTNIMFHQIEAQGERQEKMSGVKHKKTHTLIQKPVNNLNLLRFPQLYQVGIMSGNQTRPKCFDTSQWMSSSP